MNVSELEGNVYIKVRDIYDGTEWVGEALSTDLLPSSENPWRRITCTFELLYGYGSDFEISIVSVGKNAVYVDDVQAEAFAAPSNYNMLGDLSLWTLENCTLGQFNTAYQREVSCIALSSQPHTYSSASITVPINKPSDTAFMFSVWAEGTSIPTGDFRVDVAIKYSGVSEKETSTLYFQTGITIGGQFLTGMIVPEQSNKTIENIEIKVLFANNAGGMNLYNFALVEESAQTYAYDENGNLIAANQNGTEPLSSSYDSANNLTAQSQGNENYTYTYKTTGNTHLVDTVTSDGVTMKFTYDTAGNVTGTTITAVDTDKQISSGTSYTIDKNFVSSVTDTTGNTTNYVYNSKDLLQYSQNANGNRVYYEYDSNTDRQTKAYINGVVTAAYTYTNGTLSQITRTGTANGTSKTQNYTFTYDGFGNVTQVKVGSYVLVSYEYAPNNGNLKKTTYGNGTVIENIYDKLDRIVQIKYNNIIKYKYAYNGNGDLCRIEDVLNDITYHYEYDSLDRLITSYTTIGNSVRTISEYEYDGKSRVSEYHCGMVGAIGGNLNQNYAYAYNDENGTLNSMTVSSGSTTNTLNYSYDPLQRLTSQTTVRTGLTLAKEYSYKNLSGNRTTTQVSGYTAKVNGSVVDTYSYSYDNLGNITIVSRNNGQPIYYTYDAQNQLIEVNDGTFRYEYTYDTYGNILSVGWFDAITDDEISIDTYAYGNSQWVDRLTEFNGVEFDYDQIGNPLSYYNGYSYTFTWNGRELATATKGSTSVSYKYGADGLRTQKTVGSTVYNYYYADGLLIRQTWGTNYMDFLYDESGSAYSFIYNGTQYYYVKNLQGDVMRIVDTSGTVVANYFYDAWGKVTNSGTIIGLYNPIRYRGYYYDTDTGFYYLQSRYYDPAVKRFISADDTDNLGANGDFTSLNLYAYCGNNPVMGYDPMGKWTISWGGNVSACCFIGVSCSWNLVIDSSGNVAFQVSKSNLFKKGGYGAGIMMGTPSISASNAFTWTKYDTYESLEGEGLSLGFSAAKLGGELILPMSGEFDVDGFSISRGEGLSLWGDVHVTASMTETKWNFNIYEVADKFKNSWKSFWNRERN